MSAVRLIPWPLHQAFVYVAGALLVLTPFLLDVAEGGPLGAFLGGGVVLLATGVLGREPAGVAHLLPVGVHAGLVYLTGFFLLLAPFVLDFADEASAMAASVFSGLAVLVVALLTAFPPAAPAEEPQTEH